MFILHIEPSSPQHCWRFSTVHFLLLGERHGPICSIRCRNLLQQHTVHIAYSGWLVWHMKLRMTFVMALLLIMFKICSCLFTITLDNQLVIFYRRTTGSKITGKLYIAFSNLHGSGLGIFNCMEPAALACKCTVANTQITVHVIKFVSMKPLTYQIASALSKQIYAANWNEYI